MGVTSFPEYRHERALFKNLLPKVYIITLINRSKPCNTNIAALLSISEAPDRGSEEFIFNNLGEGGTMGGETTTTTAVYCNTSTPRRK